MKKRRYLLLSGFLALFTMLSSMSVQASEEEEKGSYDPLHYETEKGTVDYVGQEYATAGMLLRTEEDPSKTTDEEKRKGYRRGTIETDIPDENGKKQRVPFEMSPHDDTPAEVRIKGDDKYEIHSISHQA